MNNSAIAKTIPIFSVKDCLKSKLYWWKTFANPFISDIIEHGYQIPFLSVPKISFIKNNKSARDHPQFVEESIADLLKSGVIKEVTSPPTVVNPLTVAVNASGKKRLVLDLRTVNPLVDLNKMTFEDLRYASDFFKVDQFMVSFDLKSAYHQISIHENFQTFLGFAWYFDSKPRYFVYTSLPFGLNSAGYIFTKVMRTLVKKWRSAGYKICLYLDDGLLVCDSQKDALSITRIIRQDLHDAGVVVNEEKSNWSPVQSLTWLGFVLDSHKNEFRVPEDKRDRIIHAIKFALNSKRFSARQLSSLTGKITSLYPALGNIVYLLTKDCQLWVNDRKSWGSKSPLTYACKDELNFWLNNLHLAKTVPFEKPTPLFTKLIYSDASAVGAGAFIQNIPGSELTQLWTSEESNKSSTWRELRAVLLFLNTHKGILQKQSIKWYSDCQNVIKILNKGSMKPELNDMALSIYRFCITYSIDLSMEWIPRELNTVADTLSKCLDLDDWGVSDRIFAYFSKTVGPFTLDVFANDHNSKCLRFFSKHFCSQTSGVDAFSFSWKNEFIWAVPPPKFIVKVLLHANACKAKGVLIIPKWQSAHFWPAIHEMLQSNDNKLVILMEYQKPKNFFIKGSARNAVFSEAAFNSNVLVLRMDF